MSQDSLFDKGEAWEEQWRGMPEFKQEDLKPFKSVLVHFETRLDMEKFSRLLEQTITLDTKSLWYPKAEKNDFTKLRYVEKK